MTAYREKKPLQHLAFIMDGNRRWAKQRNKPVIEGHTEGLKTMEKILHSLFSKGIPCISVYAFSLGNWDRSEQEIDSLHKLVSRFRERNIDEYKSRGIRVKISGSKCHLSDEILELIRSIQEETEELTNGTLNICFNYGGREELVRAARTFAREVSYGERKWDDLTEGDFGNYLYTASLPDVDLVIRTSGEQRISDFLLYQSAYAEFFFTPTLWPDLTRREVEKILEEFSHRERRFGR